MNVPNGRGASPTSLLRSKEAVVFLTVPNADQTQIVKISRVLIRK